MATMSQIWHIKSSHILQHKQFTSLTISRLNAKNKNKLKSPTNREILQIVDRLHNLMR